MKRGLLDKNATIKDILDFKAEYLRHSLGLDLPHPTSQGDLSEDAWIFFLRSFLPGRYAVSKGFVFDSRGQVSEQIDVIIYDRHHSPLILETPNGECYITAESVYAVFEVKQQANKEYLEYAQDKIESVRRLHRTSRSMIASGEKVPPRKLVDIIGGLLTKSSIAQGRIRDYLAEYTSVNMVCMADAGTGFRRSDGSIEMSSAGEALPAFFYLLLDELYKLGTVAAIDIREYASVALESFRLEGIQDVD